MTEKQEIIVRHKIIYVNFSISSSFQSPDLLSYSNIFDACRQRSIKK